MSFRRLPNLFASALFVLLLAAPLCAQSGVRPRPTPKPDDEEEAESVYVEEVRIPVFAFDEKGNFDATLAVDDVLVVEDEVPQQVKSVRRTPASVVLLLGTGWDLDPIVRANTTRDVALSVIRNLREGDSLAVVQYNGKVDTLQGWTDDKLQAVRAVRKLASGEGSNMSRALKRAVEMLSERPVGNRHLVIIADGIDTAGSKDYEDASRRLVAAQTTLHVISYTEVAREGMKKPWWKAPPEAPGATQARADQATVGIDPTRPPGMRGAGINPPSVNSGLRIDPSLRRRRREAEREMLRGESRLKSLTEETGGRILQPDSVEGMMAEGGSVAREIDSQYVVTYSPKRPLRPAPPTEYRKLHVGARRQGLNLRARRGYIVGTMRQPEPKGK